MDSRWPAWVDILSHCVTQASGKQRRIDDAKKALLNAHSNVCEKLRLVSALLPVLIVKLMVRYAMRTNPAFLRAAVAGRVRAQSGGDDQPDAYRHIPTDPVDLDVSNVSVYDSELEQFVFQEVRGPLFGEESTVHNYHRWQPLLTATVRRWIAVPWGTYFDDSSVVDLSTAAGAGQRGGRAVFREFGAPHQA